MPRDGTKNLQPLNTKTKEEQKMITSKGGKASGAARRKRKLLKELLETALQGKNEDGITYDEAITKSLIETALRGDTKAYEVIRDTLGEKPVDTVRNITPPTFILKKPSKKQQ